MADEADKIVEAVVPQVTTKEELKNAGKTSAYDIARTNVQAADKIKAAGISGAKLKASSLLKEKEKTAVNEARKLTKGDKLRELHLMPLERMKSIMVSDPRLQPMRLLKSRSRNRWKQTA